MNNLITFLIVPFISQLAFANSNNFKSIPNKENKNIENTDEKNSEIIFQNAQENHRGIGTSVNYAKSIVLYKESAKLGNIKAINMLTLIYSKPETDGIINSTWMQQLAFIKVSNDDLFLIKK